MRKIAIVFMVVLGIVSNATAFINFGLRGGYAYESLTPKEVHQITKTTTGSTTTTTDTTYTPTGEEAETKHPQGFGGELVCEIIPPVIPLGIEVNAGSYTTSFKELDNNTEYTYTINSMKLSALGKYFIPMPFISPWVGIGPFVAFNSHKVKFENLNIVFEGEKVANFGLLGGAGANIGMLPKLSLNVGVLFNYLIVAKSKSTSTWSFGNTTIETTSETKFSQWNINPSISMTYKIM